MALGKNLTKKKLISAEEEKPVAKKKSSPQKKAKKVVAKKKELIPKKTKSAEKKKPIKKEKAASQKKKPTTPVKVPPTPPIKEENKPVIDPSLPLYIANELREKKEELRKKYAQEIAEIQNTTLQFVSFKVGSETYAIDIDRVKEIVQVPALSQTPNTPDHIKGLANVRGNTYVVFDLAVRFHVNDGSEPKYLLIINHKQVNASLLLSFLPSTFKIGGNNISSEMRMIEDASLDISYIKGIIQQSEKLIYYLDIVEMLKSDKAVVIPDNLMSKKG